MRVGPFHIPNQWFDRKSCQWELFSSETSRPLPHVYVSGRKDLYSIKSTGSVQHVFHYLNHHFLWTKRKKKEKKNHQQQQQPKQLTQETAFNMHYPRNTGKTQYNKANMPHCPRAGFLSQKATYFTFFFFFVVLKIIVISNVLTAVFNQAEKRESSETRKPHDIITSPCTWLCSIPQDSTDTYTHCKSCNWHTHLHAHAYALCKTKYKLDINQNISVWHLPESTHSGCTKAKEAFMAEMFNNHNQ